MFLLGKTQGSEENKTNFFSSGAYMYIIFLVQYSIKTSVIQQESSWTATDRTV